MFSETAFSVVFVSHHDPRLSLGFVGASYVRNAVKFTCHNVLDVVGLAIRIVNGTNEHVVADVIQVTSELQPGSGHGDVVSCALSSSLDEHDSVGQIFAVPLGERVEKLKPVAGGRNVHRQTRTIGSWSLVCILACVKAVWWEEHSVWCFELEAVDVRRFWVEIEGSRESHHGGDVR